MSDLTQCPRCGAWVRRNQSTDASSWPQVPPHVCIEPVPRKISKMSDQVHRLKNALYESYVEQMSLAFDAGYETPAGLWTAGGCSDAEQLVQQLGLDPEVGYHDISDIRERIPAAAKRMVDDVAYT